MNSTLTPSSLALFIYYADEAEQWDGTPLIGDGILTTRETRGNLSDLVKKRLISIQKEEGESWLFFTNQGIEFAGLHDIDLSWIEESARAREA